MSDWDGLLARLRALRWSGAERRMDEEFRTHLEMATVELMRQGLSREDAHREAMRGFGAEQALREEMRDQRGMRWLRDLLQDARYAIRMMVREPVFSGFVVVTLMLAIGATTAVFSLVRRAVIEPLPYPDSHRVVALNTRYNGWGILWGSLSEPEVYDLASLHTLSSVAAYRPTPVDLLTGEQAERLRGVRAAASLWQVLGVGPQLGRVFTAADDLPGAAAVVVLTDMEWRKLGADPGMIGKQLRLNGVPTTVIGVMPASFDFAEASLLIPLKLDRAHPGGRGGHYLQAVGRLAPDANPFRLSAELATLTGRLRHDFSDNYRPDMRWELVTRSLQSAVLGDASGALRLLTAAVILVLLIACANIANLFLARMRRREREVALRTMLGAGRGRLVRQLLTEAAVLSLAGAALGVVVAVLGANLLLTSAPNAIPRATRLSVDPAMLAIAAGLAVTSALLFGLLPALRGTRDLAAAARGSRGSTGTGWQRRGAPGLMASLVSIELALAVLVVISAGLLLRSYGRLEQVDLGFRPDHVLAFDVTLPEVSYGDSARRTRFFVDLLSRVRQVPGVIQAGGVRSLPLRSGVGSLDIELQGHPVPPGKSAPSPNFEVVTPGYFEAMGVPIISGRAPAESDDMSRPVVAWVNQAAATRLWPGEDPLGKRFRFDGDTAGEWFTVAGVVGDVHTSSVATKPVWEYYLAHAQLPRAISGGGFHQGLSIVVRTSSDPAVAAPQVRRVLAQLDPGVAPALVETMRDVVSHANARPRLLALLLGTFASLAALLAMVGITGVLSYAVTQRRREIGIRLALGARNAQVVQFIARQGLIAALVGLVIGAVAALAGSRMMQSMLFGVGPHDALVFATSVAGLALVACAAAAFPAHRATRIAPVETLREE